MDSVINRPASSDIAMPLPMVRAASSYLRCPNFRLKYATQPSAIIVPIAIEIVTRGKVRLVAALPSMPTP